MLISAGRAADTIIYPFGRWRFSRDFVLKCGNVLIFGQITEKKKQKTPFGTMFNIFQFDRKCLLKGEASANVSTLTQLVCSLVCMCD